jgi:hypothetical protein
MLGISETYHGQPYPGSEWAFTILDLCLLDFPGPAQADLENDKDSR